MNKRTSLALDDLAGCIVIAIRELGLNELQHPQCVFRLIEARQELKLALKAETCSYYASKWEGDDEYVVCRNDGKPPLPGTYSKAAAEAYAAKLNSDL